MDAVREVDEQKIVKVKFGSKVTDGEYELDLSVFANQNEAEVSVNQNEEMWEPLTVVVTNLQKSGEHYQVTCFRDSD